MLKLKSTIHFIQEYAMAVFISLSLLLLAIFFFITAEGATRYLIFYGISFIFLIGSTIPWITNKRIRGFLINIVCSLVLLQITRTFYEAIMAINQGSGIIYYMIPAIYFLLIVFICISSINYHRFGFAHYHYKEFIKINDKEIIFSDKNNKKNILLINELCSVNVFSQPNCFPIDGMCWILSGKNQELRIYNDVEGTTELLVFLQQLPNFNNERFLDALSATENNLFLLWKQ